MLAAEAAKADTAGKLLLLGADPNLRDWVRALCHFAPAAEQAC
jgi:hypothetical protein